VESSTQDKKSLSRAEGKEQEKTADGWQRNEKQIWICRQAKEETGKIREKRINYSQKSRCE
jgi:subtilase family serine protease